MRVEEVRKSFACLALLAPVILLYISEYLGDPNRPFTGFIQYDQPYYMALAKEVARPGFHLLYGNPCSPDPATPAIYFQPHIFLLGLIEKVTGIDPGVLYVLFGFVAALAGVRVAMALYEQIAGLRTGAQWIGLVLFVWGGGFFALTGLLFHLLAGSSFSTTLTDLFCFDPAQGWWFLNLGRNLVFPTEGYYHALALGAMLALLRRDFRAALWLLFALALSHPFTGLEFLLIALTWCAVETVAGVGDPIPTRFKAMLLVLLAFHLGYNVVLLNQFPEQRSITAQWRLPWTESLTACVAADLLVAMLALASWRLGYWKLRASPAARLLAVWFVMAFALVHHDLLISPIQPLHFSRGYVWIPLFLLGVPTLNAYLSRVMALGNARRFAALTLIGFIGLADNAAWFGLHTAMAWGPRMNIPWLVPDGFHVTPDARALFAWLKARPRPYDDLLISQDADSPIVYLAMTYTDYRSWYSHDAVTPFAAERRAELADFAANGIAPNAWQRRNVLVISKRSDGLTQPKDAVPVFRSGPLIVYQRLIAQ